MPLKFSVENGTKPSTQARRYVDAVLANALGAAIRGADEHLRYWFLGGIEAEPDRRRVIRAMERLRDQLRSRR